MRAAKDLSDQELAELLRHHAARVPFPPRLNPLGEADCLEEAARRLGAKPDQHA